jgi:hypothetical protein
MMTPTAAALASPARLQCEAPGPGLLAIQSDCGCAASARRSGTSSSKFSFST